MKHEISVPSVLLAGVLLSLAGSDSVRADTAAARAEAAFAGSGRVKNIILLINDGMSWGSWDAASYWEYGSRGRQPYDRFPVKLGVTTYPLNTSSTPTHDSIPRVSYDPAKAWDVTPLTGAGQLPFAGYEYLKTSYTDSAASATAMASGIKTYNNSINLDNFGNPVAFITQMARRQGKATGVVTSVPFPHATPAAFAAQNLSRNNYGEIAHQMLTSNDVDLIMGTGAPGFTRNGSPCEAQKPGEEPWDCSSGFYQYMTQADWVSLSSGTLKPHGSALPWKVIRTRQEFEALASGALRYPGPLFGSPQVAQTLQETRQAGVMGEDRSTPSGIAFVGSVPTLATMTLGALRHLSRDQDGFFLMVEGGAADWANHTSASNAPEYGQAIEETQAFNRSVAAVVAWVEKNSSWKETLVIVTTDHGNGLLLGPNADTVAFEPVQNRGAGVLPGMSYRKIGTHTNELALLWAKGRGAERFFEHIRGMDHQFRERARFNYGWYVDNTDVFRVMKAALEGDVWKYRKP